MLGVIDFNYFGEENPSTLTPALPVAAHLHASFYNQIQINFDSYVISIAYGTRRFNAAFLVIDFNYFGEENPSTLIPALPVAAHLLVLFYNPV